MLRPFAIATALILVCAAASAAKQGGPIPVPLPLFPANNWWNVDISSAPVDPNSTALMNATMAPDRQMHPDFGGNNDEEPEFPIYGIPYLIVEGNQTKLTVQFDVPEESDGVNHIDEDTHIPFPFYPIPSEAITMTGWVEGGQPGNVDQRLVSDRHILIVDKTNNHLYELYNVFYNGTGWEAFSGAFFDMNTNNRRPDTWTSADAAGLAILPGLVRYEEAYGPDEIGHAFRVTVSPSAPYYVYPASHHAGNNMSALPMGARLRLKVSTDISSYAPEIRRIFRAMKKYGLIVADNGSDLFVSGMYDTRWDNDILNPAFHSLEASDFEVIQLGWHPAITFVLTLPATAGANDALSATLTAYNQNYTVATGYTGTVQFTKSDGAASVPANYTFTAGDAGTHTFPVGSFVMRTPGSQTVTVTDVVVPTNTLTRNITVGPPTPIGLAATAATPTSINVSWTASTGATHYEIARASAPSGAYVTLTTTHTTTNYLDSPVSAGASYVYKVKAIDTPNLRASSFSIPDAATTIFFTDDPLTVNVTSVKAVHVTQLRQAANAMLGAAGLSASSFTDPDLNTTVAIKAVHLQELRTAMNQARGILAVGTIAFTDPALVAGTTAVKAVHVQELRNGAK